MLEPIRAKAIGYPHPSPTPKGVAVLIMLDFDEAREIVRTGQMKESIVDGVMTAILRSTPDTKRR